ncbi:hypothetical protein CONPUDRAFT_164992 [Coniophora puteana RWD-64-598 SS2]|uniref:Chromo domain-containing protein n=1 Tax=Coniophora puteana (strain RWD-64-598) TaxID=741705 RepID=A0A5M3MT80_CONPW|nr:uncharacterized protein CONPUDRAFT_164992 [Coniophora puteana RWD-64-598 SS2]EIW82379.1 hypothetical protein CONPUDRAFT_164992 [Coniophora puteana RWD-64-598 SS2]
MNFDFEGKLIQPSEKFDLFWRFTTARHEIDVKRRAGLQPPWTDDPVLETGRFCNVYRILDRASQYLVTDVIETGSQDFTELIFRILLFTTFTKIDTWEVLRKSTNLTWADYDRCLYERTLKDLHDRKITLYTGAYQKPAPDLGFSEAYLNHLTLLEKMMETLPDFLNTVRYAEDVFDWLCSFEGIGDFTAYQYFLNLSYSDVLNFSEDDFVVLGPGSRNGLQECFEDISPRASLAALRWMKATQRHHFKRLGLTFDGLGPSRLPMQLCDIEHTLCEFYKYLRSCNGGVQRSGRNFRSDMAPLLKPVRLPKAWDHADRQIIRIRPPVEKYEVEEVVDHKWVGKSRMFQVYWVGYSVDEATWEPEQMLRRDAKLALEKYLQGIQEWSMPSTRPKKARRR